MAPWQARSQAPTELSAPTHSHPLTHLADVSGRVAPVLQTSLDDIAKVAHDADEPPAGGTPPASTLLGAAAVT